MYRVGLCVAVPGLAWKSVVSAGAGGLTELLTGLLTTCQVACRLLLGASWYRAGKSLCEDRA